MMKRKIISFLLVLTVFLSMANFGQIGAEALTLQGNCGDKEIDTALGCIPTTISGFVKKFLPILFGISGGISFLLMVFGFITIASSGSDEKKLQGAKETITSAITGLLVSIFALFILKLIAADILKIPGI